MSRLSTLPAPSPAEADSEEISLSEVGVLIVDTDSRFQLSLKSFLAEYIGMLNVTTVRSAEEALVRVEKDSSIDMLIIDDDLQGRSGVDLIQDLADQVGRPLKIILTTSSLTSRLRDDFDRACAHSPLTAVDALQKPFDYEALESIIVTAHEAEPDEPNQFLEASYRMDRQLADRIDMLEKRLVDTEEKLQAATKKKRANPIWWLIKTVFKLAVITAIVYFALSQGWVERGLEYLETAPWREALPATNPE